MDYYLTYGDAIAALVSVVVAVAIVAWGMRG